MSKIESTYRDCEQAFIHLSIKNASHRRFRLKSLGFSDIEINMLENKSSKLLGLISKPL